MAIKKLYLCRQLTGSHLSDSFLMKNGELRVSSDEAGGTVLAISTESNASEIKMAAVGRHKETGKILLQPPKPGEARADNDKILVLVCEFYRGCGGKKLPSFHIDWENAGDVTVLARASRNKGSGSEVRSLILAPADWAENISSQFVCERGYPDQIIGYKL